MAKFTVVRTKIYHAEVEAQTAWGAAHLAEELHAGHWRIKSDGVTGVIGLDGAMQRVDDGLYEKGERNG